MGKANIAETVGKVFALLEAFESEERQKILDATSVLLGDTTSRALNPTQENQDNQSPPAPAKKAQNQKNAIEFFAEKEPQSKGEEFAVAARYRETRDGATTHTKDELRATIIEARRNFDDNNFKRDIDNAQRKGLFSRGHGERGQYTLAYYGQQYIDCLPDRQKVKALRKPRKKAKATARKSKH
jgi:hypothetical protein